jgi:hypothetical protein
MLKSTESNQSINIPKCVKVIGLSAALAIGIEISNLRLANAEVPIGNITPFDASTMDKTNAGVVLQNFNGQQLNGVYLRTNTQELGITNPNQPTINGSVLFKTDGTENYQLNTKVSDFYPYANLLNNKGKSEVSAVATYAKY